MRIAYDYQIFCQQTVGGISRYIARLATVTGELNDVRVVAPLHQNQYLLDSPKDLVYGKGISRYPSKTNRIFNTINFYLSKRFMLSWHPDVVHETFYSPIATGPSGTPTILTVHDMIDELFPAKNSEKLIAAKKKAINRAEHIITVSDSTKTDLINILHIDPNKISTVYHGFDKYKREINSEYCSPNIQRPFLLYVGARGGYKNFCNFLQAYAQSVALKNNMDVVAFGGGKFTGKELQFICKLGLSENQVLQVSGDDLTLGEYYSKAVAFVYPSLYEGFGLPPLEAMAHDCPVVSSDTSSMPEVIGNAAAFFNPYSIDDMTNSIESVVFSQDRKSSLIKFGRKRLEFFSWNKCASETFEIYKKLG
jgi:glycosyltransferase involved in cell wall biosynthesis